MEPWMNGRTKGREDRIHQPAMIARDWTPLMVADAADPEGNSGRGITDSQVSRVHFRVLLTRRRAEGSTSVFYREVEPCS